MIETYYIGGSPCSGKSTLAEMLAPKYDLYYFKVDDYLDAYTREGALQGRPICMKQLEMNSEQIWMRDPSLQCQSFGVFVARIIKKQIGGLRLLAPILAEN